MNLPVTDEVLLVEDCAVGAEESGGAAILLAHVERLGGRSIKEGKGNSSLSRSSITYIMIKASEKQDFGMKTKCES